MNIKNIILIFLFFSFTHTQKNYIEYHRTIAKAEDHLVNEKYQVALNIYVECFKKQDFVFAKDAFHAVQIAGYLNNKNLFDSLFVLCATQGVSLPLLKKAKLTSKQVLSDSTKYTALHTKYRNVYLSRINLKLRKEFYARYKEEQDAKNLPGVKYYKEIVYKNYLRIEELAKKDSFPSERLIGIDYGNVNPKHSTYNKDLDISNSFVYATLLHYPYSYSNLEKYLLKELRCGNTTPEIVAYLYSFEQTKRSVLYTKSIKYDSAKYHKYYNIIDPYSKQIDSVNYHRKEIGLCDIETENKKMLLTKKIGFVFK